MPSTCAPRQRKTCSAVTKTCVTAALGTSGDAEAGQLFEKQKGAFGAWMMSSVCLDDFQRLVVFQRQSAEQLTNAVRTTGGCDR
jgi:hypothetical protein